MLTYVTVKPCAVRRRMRARRNIRCAAATQRARLDAFVGARRLAERLVVERAVGEGVGRRVLYGCSSASANVSPRLMRASIVR